MIRSIRCNISTLVHFLFQFMRLSYFSPFLSALTLSDQESFQLRVSLSISRAPMSKRRREQVQANFSAKQEFLKMYSKTPPSKIKKRPNEESSSERPRKIPHQVVKLEDDAIEEKLFQFRILLPNGTSVELKLSERQNEMPIEKFIDVVKQEYLRVAKQGSQVAKRRIKWDYSDLHFIDSQANKIKIKVDLRYFKPNKCHFLWLHDGSAEPDAYEGMWDLTPDTDLLRELPDDYTFETALADLIDNSLQALWSNCRGQRRLISVDLHPDRVTIFDSGPGMDDGNLVKWGKMGASLHRQMRGKAIGGKPPYLMPFFGMFGYGGPVATMCLGKRAIVSSKTKSCSKVFTLHLERDALLSASRSENCWRTKGGTRDPTDDEKDKAPHASFTKVEIFKPKVKSPDIKHFSCKLKDIYFPYIQCDEMSGKTSTPIEFQVNGTDLAEIEAGEVATTNLHSCNGPEFILQLHFSISQDSSSMSAQNQKVFSEANARLKCIYFPTVQGKENIERILDKLQEDGCGIRENFESFSRVSIRRLGRLLPDTRWGPLPFMEPKLRRGEKGKILKRICSRVKCFIDTDSGFNPTPHKTDLAQHHPYTKALKNFGNRQPENEKEVEVEAFKDGKKLTLTELQKQYNDWISEMHNCHDEEIDGGLDQPIIIVGSPKTKNLDLSADVLRVHRKIERKGHQWTAGQKMKIIKGACAGCYQGNVYATLEYIILEGLPGDASGEARLICRPLGLPEDRGCHILDENGNKTIDIHDSLALPIRVIDSEKCVPVDDFEWGKRLEAHNQKLPSSIDLLSNTDCQELEIEGGFPTLVQSGDSPPDNIVAVIRPKSFNVQSNSNKLDQKFIIRNNLEMIIEVKHRARDKSSGESTHIYSAILPPTSRKGLHGLYILPLRTKRPQLFQKAGFLTFSLSLKDTMDVRLEQVVEVQASAKIGRWKIVNHNENEIYTVRVDSYSKPISVACFDRYKNRVPFSSVPKLIIKLTSRGTIIAQVRNKKVDLTSDNSTMRIEELLVKSSRLDDIRPNYKATINISRTDETFSVDFPCRVLPGTPEKITVHPPNLRKQLHPGQIIEELALEVFDVFGNHVKEDETIALKVDGLSVQDGCGIVSVMGTDFMKKVDKKGFLDLSSTLKVSKGYGKDVHLSVISKERVIFKMQFQTETRELRSVQKVFKNYEAGSQLENIVFEITDSEGKVDESIHDEEKHGQSHTLTIKSNSFDVDDTVRYSFRNGRCTIRSIPLPQREGIFSIAAVHSRYPELNSVIEVHVENVREHNLDTIGNDDDMKYLIFSDQRPCENEQIFLHSPPMMVSQETIEAFTPQGPKERVSPITASPVLKTPEKDNISPDFEKSNIRSPPIFLHSPPMMVSQETIEAFTPQGPKERVSPITASPVLKTPEKDNISPDFEKSNIRSPASASISLNGVEDDLLKSAMAVNDHDGKLQRLTYIKSQIKKDLLALQAPCDRKLTLREIQGKSESAAAVICRIPFDSRPQDVVGVVALLATVDSIELSRMLAQYLGEDQMLAIVCRNYAAAYHLETNTLRDIKGGFLAVCLEDIRANIGEKSSDGQPLLQLAPPTLPNGNEPQGFKGYAIDLISIEESHLQWRPKSGVGLRDTLFYRLFGELQVYTDRSSMMAAHSCIKDGAVSLDGSIMRGNGLIYLGHREPEILFSVRSRLLHPKPTGILQLENNLGQVNKMIDEESESLQRAQEWHSASQEKYKNYASHQNSSL